MKKLFTILSRNLLLKLLRAFAYTNLNCLNEKQFKSAAYLSESSDGSASSANNSSSLGRLDE